jgi:hypothetical protein
MLTAEANVRPVDNAAIAAAPIPVDTSGAGVVVTGGSSVVEERLALVVVLSTLVLVEGVTALDAVVLSVVEPVSVEPLVTVDVTVVSTVVGVVGPCVVVVDTAVVVVVTGAVVVSKGVVETGVVVVTGCKVGNSVSSSQSGGQSWAEATLKRAKVQKNPKKRILLNQRGLVWKLAAAMI